MQGTKEPNKKINKPNKESTINNATSNENVIKEH